MTHLPDSPDALPQTARLSAAAILLGVALGGFFDGILLHQILQWHHLVSNLEDVDLPGQLLADGLFHALMYLLALGGLIGLWRARRAFTGRALMAGLLVGFGLWHVLDAVLVHWLLGLHRIRMETAQPLLWDLLFFIPGSALTLAGLWLGRAKGGGPLATAVLPLLFLVTFGAGMLSFAPVTPSPGPQLVVLAPGLAVEQGYERMAALGGRPVTADPSGRVWLVDLPPETGRWQQIRAGLLPLSAVTGAGGCASWVEARAR